MGIAKDEAKKLIEKLPNDATWDDIMYELYVKQKVEASLEAAASGNVTSHEDVKKRFSSQ